MSTAESKHDRQRFLLANIAAHGILGHNSSTDMPRSFALQSLLELMPLYDADLLRSDLDDLTAANLLWLYNTGHNGYGNSYIPGVDTWRITAQGLIVLWTTPVPQPV